MGTETSASGFTLVDEDLVTPARFRLAGSVASAVPPELRLVQPRASLNQRARQYWTEHSIGAKLDTAALTIAAVAIIWQVIPSMRYLISQLLAEEPPAQTARTSQVTTTTEPLIPFGPPITEKNFSEDPGPDPDLLQRIRAIATTSSIAAHQQPIRTAEIIRQIPHDDFPIEDTLTRLKIDWLFSRVTEKIDNGALVQNLPHSQQLVYGLVKNELSPNLNQEAVLLLEVLAKTEITDPDAMFNALDSALGY